MSTLYTRPGDPNSTAGSRAANNWGTKTVRRVDELLATARRDTGLDDFGEDSFREGLERLVRAMHDEADLNDLGVAIMRDRIVKLLTSRLEIEDWYHRHPEIDDEPIVQPLIGLGLPRTGSTALAFLLAEDPNARSLLHWESGEPTPPPSTVEGPDPRIARAEAAHASRQAMSPRNAALVPSSPTGPMECQELMGLDFKAHYFMAFASVPSYASWLLDADLSSTYRYERRVLKLLQWGSPARPWRLKCPSHLLWLPFLDQAFPDARFVMTHRDPTDVLISVMDVYVEVAKLLSDDVDHHYVGRVNVEHWTEAMRRVMAFRDTHDDRFFDLDFRAVQSDPIGEIRRLYRWLDQPVSPEFEAGMQRWWSENAESRTPNVHPDPATFGVDVSDLREQFTDYIDRVAAWTAP